MVSKSPAQITPHKLYKVPAAKLGQTGPDLEVILDRECDWELNDDGSHKRATAWMVRQVTIHSGTFPNADFRFGEPFRVEATELSPMHRTIKVAA